MKVLLAICAGLFGSAVSATFNHISMNQTYSPCGENKVAA